LLGFMAERGPLPTRPPLRTEGYGKVGRKPGKQKSPSIGRRSLSSREERKAAERGGSLINTGRSD